MRDEGGQVDVSWREHVKLLQARDGFSLHEGVIVVLHDSATHQTAETSSRNRPRVSLQFGTDAGDKCAEALAKTLVHVDVRGRNAEQELQYERKGRLDVLTKHRSARVRHKSERMQSPNLQYINALNADCVKTRNDV